VPAPRDTPPPATCRFSIMGDGQGGVRSANMTCSGAPVSLVADAALLGRHAAGWTGVSVETEECRLPPCPCLLIVTSGNNVTFADSVLANVTYTEDVQARWLPLAMLCVTNSQVRVRAQRGTARRKGTCMPRRHQQVCTGSWG
jgi:hypothetical protein